MAINKAVTVQTSPTVLYESNGPEAETLALTGTGTITIGGAGVTAATGPAITLSATPIFLKICDDVLYAVCATGTVTALIAAWLSDSNS